MILLVHMLFGVAVASLMPNIYLAILASFLSHYFLDFFPHVEYSINNIKEKNWKKSLPEFVKVFFDFTLGVVLILIFSEATLIVFLFAFFSILPDGISLLNAILKNKILDKHSWFHQKKIHFLSHKKIPIFWRFFTQIIAVIISIYILNFV